ncbi:MAG: chemotaxis protein CheW [Gallionella sp.]|nr:chemotaxis protein CheW [Gallionella sp.]
MPEIRSPAKKADIDALKAQINAEIATRPQINNTFKAIDVYALKAQVDAEIAARMAAEADSARYVHRRGFHAGDLRLLVNLSATSEVVEMPPLFCLPGAPAGIKGIANRHGRVVPVLDLSILFGAQHFARQHDAAKVWLLVCGRGDVAVGLVVDSLPEHKKFAVEDEASLSEVAHPIATYAKSAYREGQDIWIDLDTEALFASVFQVDPLAF